MGVGHLSCLARRDLRLPMVQGTQQPPQGYSRMEMERAMPAMADHFARGFKVEGGGEEVVDVVGVVGVVGVVRSRILKRDEGVEEEMIRKCAVASRVEWVPE